MNNPLRIALSWALYGLGHAACFVGDNWRITFALRLYFWAMIRSERVQGESDNGPWNRVMTKTGDNL